MIPVSQIAEFIDGTVEGDEHLPVRGVSQLEDGNEGCISFVSNPAYYRYFNSSAVSVVIVGPQFDIPAVDKTLIRVKNPTMGFAKVLELFNKRPDLPTGIDPSAVIDPSAMLGKSVSIQANAVVGRNAVIGAGTYVGPGTVIGEGTKVGSDVVLHANVTLYDGVSLGNRVTIDSGSVIGADGFGWVSHEKKHYKIPQIGGVIIHDDVTIGAACTIDRGTFQNTIVGKGTRMDNQIQIGHNVQIGEYCLFASFLGVAGSTTIGNYVTIAGQVGIVDHIHVGDHCVIASKSAVFSSVEGGSFISGIPAREHKARLRQDVVVTKLPDLLKRIRMLEHKVKDLEEEQS